MAAEQSYIESIKQMREMRTQQLRAANDQRLSNAKTNSTLSALTSTINSFNKTIVSQNKVTTENLNQQKIGFRQNQRVIESVNNLAKSMVSTITNLTSTIARGALGAAKTGAGAAVDVGGGLLSGVARVLPLGIVGLLGKIFLWDNLDASSKSKLTKALGGLFSGLFDNLKGVFKEIVIGVMNVTDDITDYVKKLDLKFPLLEGVIKKIGILVETTAVAFKILVPYLERIIGFAKENPKTAAAGALALLNSKEILAVLTSVASSIAGGLVGAYVFRNVAGQAITRGLINAGVPLAAGAAGQAGTRAAGKGAMLVGEAGIARAGGGELAATGTRAILGKSGPGAVATLAKTLGTPIMVADLLTTSSGGKIDFESWETEVLSPMATSRNRGAVVSVLEQNQSGMGEGFVKVLLDAVSDIGLAQASTPGTLLLVTSRYSYIATGTTLTVNIGGRKYIIPDFYPVFTQEYNKILKSGSDEVKKNIKEDKFTTLTQPQNVTSMKQVMGVIKKYEAAGDYNRPYSPTGQPFVQPNKPLTEMTLSELEIYAEQQRKATVGKLGPGFEGKGTTATGAYQMLIGNVMKYSKDLGLDPSTVKYSKDVQDALAAEMIKNDFNQFIKNGSSAGLIDYVTRNWQIFQKNPKAKQELERVVRGLEIETERPITSSIVKEMVSPITDAEGKLKVQTLETEELLFKQLRGLIDKLGEPIDTTIATIGGESAADIAGRKIKDLGDKTKKYVDSIRKEQQERKYKFLDPNMVSGLMSSFDPDKMKGEIVSDLRQLSKDLGGFEKPQASEVKTYNNNFNYNINNSGSSGGSGYAGVNRVRPMVPNEDYYYASGAK
jgi:hypothetical protein